MVASAPEVGIYSQVLDSHYHSWTGASSSRLKDILRSPGHCRYKMLHPQQSTGAMKIGTAVHSAVLQPDEFERCFLRGKFDKKSNKGKEAFAKAVLQYDADRILAPDDFDTVLRVRDAVLKSKTARKLLDASEEKELSIIFRDDKTDVLCKARLDAVCSKYGFLVDIKTTDDASPAAFARTILKYKYHLQAAHYLKAAKSFSLGDSISDFVFIAVEKTAPYAVGVYRLSVESLKEGQQERLKALTLWSECWATQCWPLFPDQIVEIEIPAYGFNYSEEEE